MQWVSQLKVEELWECLNSAETPKEVFTALSNYYRVWTQGGGFTRDVGDLQEFDADAPLIRAAAYLRLGDPAKCLELLDALPRRSKLHGLLRMRRACVAAISLHALGRTDEAQVQVNEALRYWYNQEFDPLQREVAELLKPEALSPASWEPSTAYREAVAIEADRLDEIAARKGQRVTVKGRCVQVAPTLARDVGANAFLNSAPDGLRVWLFYGRKNGIDASLLDKIEGKEVIISGKVEEYDTKNLNWPLWNVTPESAEDIRVLDYEQESPTK